MGRRINGEGTIYRRKDGRYEGAAYFLTTSGARKRIRIYARTREEAHEKLTEAKAQAQRGIPVPDRVWKVGGYLDQWLERVVRPNRRPKTYSRYESIVRLYLKPKLGTYTLKRLTVPAVQAFLNQQQVDGCSVRNAQVIREVLSSALTQAMREELLNRNVARLVELPTYRRKKIYPWSPEEARQFLEYARGDTLYPAFLLLVVYGLRQGEVLGLRWCDIDFDTSELHVEQQLQRVNGVLYQAPVKSEAGNRDLRMLDAVRDVLAAHQIRQADARSAAGSSWMGAGTSEELVFTTRTGRPVEPRNFARSFDQICAGHNVRRISMHHVRHTQGTFLEAVGATPRQAQVIMGHSNYSTTKQIYTHPGKAGRSEILERVGNLLLPADTDESSQTSAVSSRRCRQNSKNGRQMVAVKTVSAGVLTEVEYGADGGTRTHDPLFTKSIFACPDQRTQSVFGVLKGRARQWLIGVVAVELSRQRTLLTTSDLGRYPVELLWSILSHWSQLVNNLYAIGVNYNLPSFLTFQLDRAGGGDDSSVPEESA